MGWPWLMRAGHVEPVPAASAPAPAAASVCAGHCGLLARRYVHHRHHGPLRALVPALRHHIVLPTAVRPDQAVVQDATLGVSPCQVTEGGEGRRQRKRRARVEHRLCSALGRIGWGAICSAPSPPLDGSDRKTSRATLNRCSRHFHEVLLSTRHLPRKAEFTSSRNRAIYGRPTIAYGAAYALLLYMRLAAQPSALPYHCRPCTPTAPPAAQTWAAPPPPIRSRPHPVSSKAHTCGTRMAPASTTTCPTETFKATAREQVTSRLSTRQAETRVPGRAAR